MWQDSFADAMDDTVTLDAIDNGDNRHVVVNLTGDDGNALGIALTAAQANALADTLRALAAGLDG